MKSLKKVIISSVICAALMGSSSAWAASLSTDGILNNDGKLMLDIQTYAGKGDFDYNNGALHSSNFRAPSSIAVLPDGSMIISDSRNHVVRKILGNQVSTWAGPEAAVVKNEQGFPLGGLIDGVANQSFFNEPAGLALGAQGRVYVADAANHAIRIIDKDMKVSTLAGNGVMGNKDGKGDNAQFNHPSDVAVASDGAVYVADTLNHLIRKIAADGTVTTLNAPSTRYIQVRPGEALLAGDYKDGRLKEAHFNEPSGLALDTKGNLYVSDTGNHSIRYIDLTAGTVTTVAGGSLKTDKNSLYAQGDFADGDAMKALFDFPKGLAVTSEGGLVIADSLNHSIRYLLNGKVSTLVGNQRTGESNGTETNAQFYAPTDVAVLADGSLVVADSLNNQLRTIIPYQLPTDLPSDTNIKVVYGSKLISFEAQPEMNNGRTMVPLRAISEELGYEVKFVEQNGVRAVQLMNGDLTIELYINQTGIKKIEKSKTSAVKETDAAPYIKSDLTYVPVRFFAEEIGLDVQWDVDTRTAIIR